MMTIVTVALQNIPGNNLLFTLNDITPCDINKFVGSQLYTRITTNIQSLRKTNVHGYIHVYVGL